jgi:Na+-transporting methylmalonyl-CoA/oxaloacetate decarboxylase gamma subunit
MEAINLGLQLSLYGIVITFLALGLLILLISLLQALFPAKVQEPSAAADTLLEDGAGDPDARLVALTAAWWYWQKKKSSSLGQQLEKGPGKRWRKIDKA